MSIGHLESFIPFPFSLENNFNSQFTAFPDINADDFEVAIDQCAEQGQKSIDCSGPQQIPENYDKICHLSFKIACAESLAKQQCASGEKIARNSGNCDLSETEQTAVNEISDNVASAIVND